MKGTIYIIAMILFLNLTSACATRTNYVQVKPPVRKIEVKSVKPGHKYVWVEGHWKWSKTKKIYIWKEGYWIKGKRNKVWVSGHWKKTPRGWLWIQGYWK